MKAEIDGQVIADSTATIAHGGYDYFPPEAVRTACLELAPKTSSDLECPHGVQFYDVVLAGRRYPRAAWAYLAPRPALAAIAGRFGFWEQVRVG